MSQLPEIATVFDLRDRIAELEGKLKIATENCAQAVKERDEHRDQLSTATTRLQHAYRLLHNVVIKDGCGSWTTAERDAWASSYKGFMNGQSHIERDYELQQAVKERDLAITDRQDSDQVAEEIAMRAGRVLQELKNWREITIHTWCSDRLDEIIAMMDWTQSEEKQ